MCTLRRDEEAFYESPIDEYARHAVAFPANVIRLPKFRKKIATERVWLDVLIGEILSRFFKIAVDAGSAFEHYRPKLVLVILNTI